MPKPLAVSNILSEVVEARETDERERDSSASLPRASAYDSAERITHYTRQAEKLKNYAPGQLSQFAREILAAEDDGRESVPPRETLPSAVYAQQAEKLKKCSPGQFPREHFEDESRESLPSYLAGEARALLKAPVSVNDLQSLDRKLNFIIDIAVKNMKYSKAVYASTKKSINGPGHESGNLTRMSVAGGMMGDMSTERSSFLNVVQSIASMNPKERGSIDIDEALQKTGTEKGTTRPELIKKVTNMFELTHYIHKNTNSRRTKATVYGKQIWRFMEDRNSSRQAAIYDIMIHILLAASTIMACVDVLDYNIGEAESQQSSATSTTKLLAVSIEFCFLAELGVRWLCSPQPGAFWWNKYNALDAVSTLPLVFRLGTLFSHALNTSDEVNAFLCLVPVFRLCKLLRRFETFHLLASAFKTSFAALPVILYTLMLIVLTFSAVIYYVEPRSTVKNFGLAIWFVLITMCGAAPGDPIPVTYTGKSCTMLLVLSGLLYISIPIGIVGTAFSQVWEDRSRLLLLHRMRTCVERAGYTPADLMAMFTVLDSDGNGSLDFEEFSAMLTVMNIDCEEKFARDVFESFDDDCEGSIDFRELLRGLFPMASDAIAENLRQAAMDKQRSELHSSYDVHDDVTFSISPAATATAGQSNVLIGRQGTVSSLGESQSRSVVARDRSGSDFAELASNATENTMNGNDTRSLPFSAGSGRHCGGSSKHGSSADSLSSPSRKASLRISSDSAKIEFESTHVAEEASSKSLFPLEEDKEASKLLVGSSCIL